MYVDLASTLNYKDIPVKSLILGIILDRELTGPEIPFTALEKKVRMVNLWLPSSSGPKCTAILV